MANVLPVILVIAVLAFLAGGLLYIDHHQQQDRQQLWNPREQEERDRFTADVDEGLEDKYLTWLESEW